MTIIATQCKTIEFSNSKPIVLIAGPCQMESRSHAIMMASILKGICSKRGIKLVYKTSFDKANRTSINGKRGLGFDKSLAVFEELRTMMPVLTDVHEVHQCPDLAHVVDILQIPAFLSRQTDLIVAAAQTGLVINVKKGQFLAPWDMKNVVQKIVDSGNDKVLLTERGASFGYNTLISDMRSLPIMGEYAPVIFDATHSVQQPGGKGDASGGERHMVPVLARAAVAVGISGVFIECHQDPDKAPSDGPNMIPLSGMDALITSLMKIDAAVK